SDPTAIVTIHDGPSSNRAHVAQSSQSFVVLNFFQALPSHHINARMGALLPLERSPCKQFDGFAIHFCHYSDADPEPIQLANAGYPWDNEARNCDTTSTHAPCRPQDALEVKGTAFPQDVSVSRRGLFHHLLVDLSVLESLPRIWTSLVCLHRLTVCQRSGQEHGLDRELLFQRQRSFTVRCPACPGTDVKGVIQICLERHARSISGDVLNKLIVRRSTINYLVNLRVADVKIVKHWENELYMRHKFSTLKSSSTPQKASKSLISVFPSRTEEEEEILKREVQRTV
ncbi:LOW QUALITY PROTEIN: hypothetical protein CVT26_014408, partial [Gymnopilus dilepis]